jgi:AcrR family transcriptional regulator
MPAKTKETSLEARIVELYKQLTVEDKVKQVSVYSFCKQLGISEADFYQHFASLDAVGRKIWGTYAEEVINALKKTPKTYAQYGAREKVSRLPLHVL